MDQQFRSILLAMDPTLNEEALNRMIPNLVRSSRAISDSCSSLEGLRAKKQQIFDSVKGTPVEDQFNATLQNFRAKKAEILAAPSTTGMIRDMEQAAILATQQSYGNRCRYEGCDKTDKLLRCSACKLIRYCSSEHQKLDWARHKVECKKS